MLLITRYTHYRKKKTLIKRTLPADAMCSLVRIGCIPTNGTCIEHNNPRIKNVVYAAQFTHIQF